MAQLLVEDPSLDPVTPSGRLLVTRQRDTTTPPSPPQGTGDNWWDAYPDQPVTQAAPDAAPPAAPGGAWWDAYPDTKAPVAPPKNDYSGFTGGLEAAGRGLMHGATMGLEPAMEGASAAAEPDIRSFAQKFGINPDHAVSFVQALAPSLKALYGAGRETYDNATSQQETPAQTAYGKARAVAAEKNADAYAQQPLPYVGANIVGGLAAPVPGLGAVTTAKTAAQVAKVGAPLMERIARGAAEGATAGGMFGAGNAVGEGKPITGVAADAAKGGVGGAVLGGTIGGTFGSRPPGPPSPGQQAAQTAEELGAPLPKAFSYDSRPAQAAGQLARQTPVTGHWIDEAGQKTMKAAEDKVGDMASQLSPDVSRSATDEAVRGAADNAIEFNKRAQNGTYKGVRDEINPDQRIKLANTERALKEIAYRRRSAGASPQGERAGLEEAWRLVEHPNGGGFNGVHRLRAKLRNPPTALKMTNPGYDAGDYNYVAAALTRDLHNIVQKTSINPPKALKLFTDAEKNFGVLAEENKMLEKIRDANAEGGLSRLLNSAKEKNGFLKQLALYKKSVPPQDFERVTGVIMSELGKNQVGNFTFAQFVRQWNAMSDPAKALLFRPEHRQWIDKIVQLAEHVKDADKLRNTSNTAGALIMFDVIKTAGELAIAAGAGAMSGHEIAGAIGGAVAGFTFGAFMASPARVASLGKWTQIYRALTANQPTPARIAAFRVATRNLANTIHVPYDRLMSIVERHMPAAQALPPDKQKQGNVNAPRP